MFKILIAWLKFFKIIYNCHKIKLGYRIYNKENKCYFFYQPKYANFEACRWAMKNYSKRCYFFGNFGVALDN